jgi:cellulose synthase/poly-beta-1,6-N-acetylglucosamine synthase-like glycosyltransferase
MDISTIIIWSAYFIGLYFTIFWLLVFLDNGAKDKKLEKLKEFPLVSVIIPAYNEEKNIKKTIESVLSLNYPKDKLQIIAVNHGSSDNTGKIMDNYKDYVQVLHISRTSKDKKAVAVNAGMKFVKGEFIACMDADSSIEKDALHKLLPHFYDDKDIGAVIPRMKAIGGDGFIKRIQWVEYVVTFLYKRLMGHVDCIHVTPGPFTVYRKKYLDNVGEFDNYNLVEDMDMALRLQKKNYKIVQTYDATVETVIPQNWKEFYSQRNRWYKGGVMNVIKHKDMMLNGKYGEFGLMQMPMMLGTALLSLMVFTIIYYQQIFKPLLERAYDWYHTGFPITISIQRFFENIHYLDFNYSRMFFIYFVIFLGFTFLLIAFRTTKTNLKEKGMRAPIYFLAFYPLLIFITWCGVVKDLVFKKKIKW